MHHPDNGAILNGDFTRDETANKIQLSAIHHYIGDAKHLKYAW